MNSSKEIFEVNGKFIKVDQDLFEIREKYLERVFFIIKKIKNGTIDDFDEYIKLSRIYVNVNLLGCGYAPELMKQLKVSVQ